MQKTKTPNTKLPYWLRRSPAVRWCRATWLVKYRSLRSVCWQFAVMCVSIKVHVKILWLISFLSIFWGKVSINCVCNSVYLCTIFFFLQTLIEFLPPFVVWCHQVGLDFKTGNRSWSSLKKFKFFGIRL